MAPRSPIRPTQRCRPAASASSSGAMPTRSPWTASPSRPQTKPAISVVVLLTRRAFLGAAAGFVVGAATATGSALRRNPDDQRIRLGDLTLLVRADPWQLSVLGPDGQLLWSEAPDEPLGFRLRSGQV